MLQEIKYQTQFVKKKRHFNITKMEIHIRKKRSGFLNKLNAAQVQPHREVLCRTEGL